VTTSPDSQQVVVLTGGTSGIGRIAATALAGQGATVAVIGRNQTRGDTLVADAAPLNGDIRFHQADLATQATVRSLATELRDTYDRIDVLVHNAGLSSRHRTETEDGVELTFAVNHLAPYLLTRQLLDRLRASAPSRVVVTASDIHRRATFDFDDLQFTMSMTRSKHMLDRNSLLSRSRANLLADSKRPRSRRTAFTLASSPRQTCSVTPLSGHE